MFFFLIYKFSISFKYIFIYTFVFLLFWGQELCVLPSSVYFILSSFLYCLFLEDSNTCYFWCITLCLIRGDVLRSQIKKFIFMLYAICQFIKIKKYFKLALFVTHKYDTLSRFLQPHWSKTVIKKNCTYLMHTVLWVWTHANTCDTITNIKVINPWKVSLCPSSLCMCVLGRGGVKLKSNLKIFCTAQHHTVNCSMSTA